LAGGEDGGREAFHGSAAGTESARGGQRWVGYLLSTARGRNSTRERTLIKALDEEIAGAKSGNEMPRLVRGGKIQGAPVTQTIFRLEGT